MKLSLPCLKSVLFAVSMSLGLEAQNYGHAFYQHSSGGANLCDALTSNKHLSQPGYMMASFKANSSSSSYNFALDRTSLGGSYSNPLMDFKKVYQIHADPTEECDVAARPIDNCAGVSIIETVLPPSPGSSQGYYAMAGAFDKGCFFTLVDAFGNCFNSCSYRFPGRDGYANVTKPLIIECSSVSGHYIICGSFNRTMYTIRVNAQGQIIWSRLYDIEGEPRDMIEAAFGPNKWNEFIVVGKSYLDYSNNLTDAFVMQLDQNTGAVYMARRLNLWSFPLQNWGNQHFNDVTVIHKESPAANTNQFGYVLAGYTDQYNVNTIGRGLYLRVDSNLNFSGIEIFGPANNANGGEVVDIVGRQTVGSTQWLYYSLVKNGTGMSVIRTNNVMGGFSSISLVNIFKEFDYLIPGQVTQPVKIGMYNLTNSPFSGLQLFGDLNTTNGHSQHLVKSYFNGLEGCYSSTSTPVSNTPGSSHPVDNITAYGGLTSCPIFYISDSEDGSYLDLCGPLDSVANGSNLRNAILSGTQLSSNRSLNLSPNPSQGPLNLEYTLSEAGTLEVSLFNLLGKEVTRFTESKTEGGTYTSQIDLNQLGLSSGVYILNYRGPSEQGSRRIVYEKN